MLIDRHQLKNGADGFEDGTGNYLAWNAVPHGLRLLEDLDMRSLEAHVRPLTGRSCGA